jgi:hypothetical protein
VGNHGKSGKQSTTGGIMIVKKISEKITRCFGSERAAGGGAKMNERIIVRTDYLDTQTALYYALVTVVTDKKQVCALGYNNYRALLLDGSCIEVDESCQGFTLYRKWSTRV